MMASVVVIDNYDSFTYNLVQYLGALAEEAGDDRGRPGFDVLVFRNDAVDVGTLEALAPAAVVISPGPGTPAQAGVGLEIIRRLGPRVPILGVCLGHQCIGAAYGGVVRRGAAPVHGKVSSIFHDGRTIFQDIPSPFQATRYHSLIVERASLPEVLEVSASLEDGTVMGLRHRNYPVEGVQFHPESVLTPHGRQLLANFLRLAGLGGGARDAPVARRSVAPGAGGG
ncbi:MAG: aminodeoxychorismate/anthranilate synthase component II [Armatimonadota bacterium]|nr:aminodeoxychorismate/anthranilate synthase component II [Armatimonadota bacterium]MDR7427828.1 aminodeoxychorismate/anthranilate synthase component II [Armatimonadota bacterium]